MTRVRPRKSPGNRGCLIAVSVVLGLCFLSVVVIGVLVYRASQDPEFQKAWSIATESVSIFVDAATAPGTDEMLEIGCRKAFVMDGSRVAEIVEQLEDADADAPDEPMPQVILLCEVGWRSALTCPELVRAYVEAVPSAPDRAAARITFRKLARREERCSGIFDRDGQFLEDIDEKAVPIPDPPSDR